MKSVAIDTPAPDWPMSDTITVGGDQVLRPPTADRRPPSSRQDRHDRKRQAFHHSEPLPFFPSALVNMAKLKRFQKLRRPLVTIQVRGIGHDPYGYPKSVPSVAKVTDAPELRISEMIKAGVDQGRRPSALAASLKAAALSSEALTSPSISAPLYLVWPYTFRVNPLHESCKHAIAEQGGRAR